MTQAILAFNSGSSSIKFAAYEVDAHAKPTLICKGMLDRRSADAEIVIKDPAGKIIETGGARADGADSDLAGILIGHVEPLLDGRRLAAAGHRIVHSGPDFSAPVRVDSDVLRKLEALTPLAPLHQPGGLAPIRTLLASRPDLPQIACFDTAFHRDLAPIYRRFPLPIEFEAKGIRRYGFHGLSFEYIAQRLPKPQTRSVIAHLGSGASLCAIRHGSSVNTTMSLTPLDGLMMATRSGAVDPGLVLYLQQSERMSASAVEDLLYRKSGLLGVSGISADMRTLLASSDPSAHQAVDQFCARIAEQIAVMASGIGGIDALVFTAGIGENSPDIRRNVCARLQWIGVQLDDNANAQRRGVISAPNSKVEVLIIPTDEEIMIAQHTRDVVVGAVS
ncbi:MAG TPA: acetate/propionate family kinase [Bradyrhizobium sp.]|nr:acetate/propionate family kinase [Bradyrhizobium sp.]